MLCTSKLGIQLILFKAVIEDKLPDIFILDDKATNQCTKAVTFKGILNSGSIMQSLKLEGSVNI
jgi:hypothetical protein